MARLILFASGKGSNALRLMLHFQNHPKIEVVLVVSDNPEAGVLASATAQAVPALVLSKKQRSDADYLLGILQLHRATHLILLGYLRLIPAFLVKAYPNRILNLHPALLPKFGGKGMFGMAVHQAVWAAKERETGITLHLVNERYDEGAIVEQAACTIDPNTDTPESIAQKVSDLEREFVPLWIEQRLLNGL